MNKPYARCYWVQPGKMLAGYIPSDEDPARLYDKVSGLLNFGIRTFINLMEPDEKNYFGLPFTPYEPVLRKLAKEQGIEVAYYNFPVRDQDILSIELMRRILNTINTSIKQGAPVYVHCWGGKGRTGTVVGCWLKEQGMVNNYNVFDQIQELRKDDSEGHVPSPETDEQREFVLSW